MGKISKALEKAKQADVAKPAQHSAPGRVRPHRETARPPVKAEPAVRPEQHPVAASDRRDMQPVKRPVDTPPPAASDQHPTPDPVPSTVEALESPIESSQTHQLEKTPPIDHESPGGAPPVPSVESKPELTPDVSRKSDGVNISLVKPEIAQPPRSVQAVARESAAEKNSMETAVPGTPTATKEVRVSYSRTKVQVNDPERLRNNKIFTVFDNLETTEQIKLLRTQVLRKLKVMGGNSILVTSANPCEGKTFTCINLGVSIAKEFDRTVLIIDADIRRPALQHTAFSTDFFSLSVEKGLTDYLMGDADISEILINPGIEKLTVIPGGVPVDNSSELLNSGRMEEMMMEIKSRYPSDRVVIVDGPAILPFPDALILSRYVDGVLPVIEAEKTSSEDLKKMMQQLKEVNILGYRIEQEQSLKSAAKPT